MRLPTCPHIRILLLVLVATHFSLIVSCQSKGVMPDTSKIQYGPSDETFEGPFDSWSNVKKDFGAIGDGKTDDTRAIQKAFDYLKFNKRRIVYFPAGTYRITKTLTMFSLIDIGVIGEDPASTTILWDGNVGETMLDCNGVSYSRFGRMTWDGASKAGAAVVHGWDGKRPHANTDGEHADEVFKDLDFGIRGGTRGKMDAECVVKRCHFENCKKAGVSVENFNAADWQVWYCTFRNCLMGVTNTYGAGYFNVYHCYFIGSIKADISKFHCGYFAARYNTSVNSACFFAGYPHSCPGLVSLQGNKIYYPTSATAILLGDVGPSAMLDNLIVTKPANSGWDAVSISKPITNITLGNRSVSNNSFVNKNKSIPNITLDLPIMPSTPHRLKAIVVEVPYGSNETIIQHLIDSVLGRTNKDVIIHFAAGNYYVSNTITIPANRKIYLVGDGFDSRINWKSLQPGGTIFRLNDKGA